MVKHGVYCWLCRATGKMYIGSSVDTLSRERQHRAMLNAGRHHSKKLQTDWDRYGEDEFEFDLINPYVCPEDIRDEEARYIQLYDTYKTGYNETTMTGHGTTIPPEVREKMSRAAKAAGKDEVLRRKRSEAAKAQHAAGKLGRGTWKPGAAAAVVAKLKGRKRPDVSARLIGNKYANKHK